MDKSANEHFHPRANILNLYVFGFKSTKQISSTMLRSTLFVLFTLIAFSCHKDSTCGYLHCIDDVGTPKQSDEEYVAYFEALAQWKCLDVEDYYLDYTVIEGVCHRTVVHVEVREDSIVKKDLTTGEFADQRLCTLEFYPAPYHDVGSLFSIIEIALDTSIQSDFTFIDKGFIRRADEISVTYDKHYGFPRRIYIDYLNGIADEELTIEVVDFQRNDVK